MKNGWRRFRSSPASRCRRCSPRQPSGKLKALYVVGSNPVARYNVDPFALKNTFTVVQDMFLTETAILADVVLPPANAYEKSGTFTNTCGDLQMLQKAGDITHGQVRFRDHRSDCERHGLRRPQPGSVWSPDCAPTWARRVAPSRAKPIVTTCG